MKRASRIPARWLRVAAALLLAVAAAAGCNPMKGVRVAEVSPPEMTGSEALNGRATVVNDTRRDLVVESARVVLRYRGRELGTARLLLPVVAAAGATTRVRYDLALEGLTAGTVRTVGMRLVSNPDAVTVDVVAHIRWGAFRKRVDLRDVPAISLANLLGP
jgi:hypothetical protein